MEQTKARLPLRIGIPFAALAIGFIGAVLYVPLALRPLTVRAEDIQHNLAESVRTLADLRGSARDAQVEALLAYQAQGDQSIDHEARLRAIASWCARFGELASAYSRLPRTAEEDAIWREVRDRDLPDLVRASERTLAAEAHPAGDPGAIQQLLDAGTNADARLLRLVKINVERTQAESSRIHDDIRRLSLAYGALAVIGAIGGLLLLVQILRILRGYADAMARRVAELEAFAGQVSHDLRTPLQTIHLAVAGIERKAEDGPFVQNMAAKAMSGVRRLDGMIQDLLQFARSGKEARENARSDVSAIVSELARDLGPHAEREQVVLTVRSEPDLVARIAPIALKTILVNLVENGIKYRQPGGDNRVEVDARSDGNRVWIRVEDAGIGIAPSALPHLFEPFFRANNRADSHGLGLATVKRLVDAHGGTIRVRSSEGQGSTFVVTLPRMTRGHLPATVERGHPTRAPMES